MPPPNPSVLVRVRAATLADADILNEIEVLSRSDDLSWTYRYPYRDDFAEDHHRFNRLKYDTLLKPDSNLTVMLAESPSLEHPEKVVPIGLSVWDMKSLPGYQAAKLPPPSISAPVPEPKQEVPPHHRRDESPAHVSAFISTHIRARQFFFDDSFAPGGYIYCMVLATHPAYQGRGAATALCRWGMEQARAQGSKMCLFSSQEDRARRLYDSKLGFVSLGAVVTRVGREEEYVRTEALGWDSRC